MAVGRLGSTYASELAKLLRRRPIEIQRALRSLEQAGLIVTRRIGTVRLAELNRRNPDYPELLALLLKLSERPLYRELWGRIGRRPRSMGKSPR